MKGDPGLPLDGLLVLSVEQAVAAPYCSCKLADAGARVIKIERAEGDFARRYDTAAHGLSSYFAWLNRGKESLVVDIKNSSDIELLHRIIDTSDIFIQNLAPGAATRAGLNHEELRSRNKKLITLDISGYGRDNSYSSMKAYDLLVQAETGLAGLTGTEDSPGRVGVSVCDIACGMAAYSGVLEALIHRSITGEGSHVETSLFSGMADWMNVPLIYFEGLGKAPPRIGLAHPSICPYGAFTTKDGQSVLISIQNEREWKQFCAIALDDADLAMKEGFHSNDARVANRDAVDGLVAAFFEKLTREEVEDVLARANTAYGFVNDVAHFSRHPALRRIAVETPGGTVSMAAPAVTWSGGRADYGKVPDLGEHSAAIRVEFAVEKT